MTIFLFHILFFCCPLLEAALGKNSKTSGTSQITTSFAGFFGKPPMTMKSYEMKTIQRSIANVLLSGGVGMYSNLKTSKAMASTESIKDFAADSTFCAQNNHETTSVIKKPNDQRDYKALTLENGLRVLLISDKESSTAAAALDVHVGSFSDPTNIPGLAHFCEHMSFLGTKKYPQEEGFSSFLSSHGGSSNAYTDSEDTVYYFDVNAGYFNDSLDRFAQFFIDPTFTQSATSRELNAIESEHAKNINNNGFRIYQLEKDTANPYHPLNRFATGNKETLETIPKKLGVDVREELLKFHKTYYSSNMMTLAILSNQDINSLELLTRKLFSAVPNRQTKDPALKWWGTVVPYLPQQAATALEIVPLDESRRISISWPIWVTSPEEKKKMTFIKTDAVLSHLIGHEGKGSLRSFLVSEKGWANGVNAAVTGEISDLQLFECGVSLTEEGFKHRYEVIDAIFGYIDLLRSKGIPSYIFQEVSQLSVIGFNFSEKAEPSDYVSKISSDMQSYFNPAEYLIGPRCYLHPDEGDAKRYMNYFQPQQSRLKIISKNFEGQTFQIGNYYGTQFNQVTLTDETMRWSKIKHTSFPSLALPAPNELIPRNFDLVATPVTDEAQRLIALNTPPKLIRKDTKWNVWYKLDNVFKQPKVYALISLAVPANQYDPMFVINSKLFAACFQESVNEYLYDAQLAGLDFKIEFSSRGLQMKLTGYNDKMTLFAEKMLKSLKEFHPSKGAFNRYRDMLGQEFSSWNTQQPYYHCSYFTSLATETMQYPIGELKAALNASTFQSLDQFLQKTLQSSFGTSLVAGNIDEAGALKLIDKIDHTLNFKPLPKELCSRRRYVEVPLASSLSSVDKKSLSTGYLISRVEPNKNDANSAVTFYFQVASRKVKDQVTMELLANAVEQMFYNSLRTRQQLGYIVYSNVRSREGYYTLSFTVQSSVATGEELTKKIELFLEQEGLPGLMKLSEEAVEDFKEGLIAEKLEPDRRLTTQAGRFWSEIILDTMASDELNPTFDRMEKEVETLKGVTKQDLVAFAKNILSPSGLNRRLIVSQVTSAQALKRQGSVDGDIRVDGLANSSPGIGNSGLQEITDLVAFRSSQKFLE